MRTAALAHNLQLARSHAGSAKVWAVIKANAYGHGLLRAAAAFAAADGLAVLDFEEALLLRGAGDDRPILMLEGFFKPQDVALLAAHALTPVVHEREQIAMLQCEALPSQIDVYLKVNSGMNRLGFRADEVHVAYQALREHPRVRRITLMTHFADADGAHGIAAQLARFDAMTNGLDGPRCLANSAALLRFPESRADWVRPGIMLYGCSPFGSGVPRHDAAGLGLQPAMTLTSELIALQRVCPGERVGYGFGFEATEKMTIGVVACGYADGYPRHAPTGTPILVAGKRTRLVGRVSMDMLCVDVSAIPQAHNGSPVILWGEGLSADEVAAGAETLSYELLCALAPRVPMVEVS